MAHRAGVLRLRWQDLPVGSGRRVRIIRLRSATIRVSPAVIIPASLVVIIPAMPAAVTRGTPAATIPTIIPRLITHRMAAVVNTIVEERDQPLGYVGRLLFKSLVVYF